LDYAEAFGNSRPAESHQNKKDRYRASFVAIKTQGSNYLLIKGK